MHRYTPMTEGYIFLPRAVRPEVKKYNPRSEVYHLAYTPTRRCIYHITLMITSPTPIFIGIPYINIIT